MSNKTKREYREWVRDRYGAIHKNNTSDKHKDKKWKINLDHIRETFIEEYNNSGYRPAYMITRNYYYDQQDRLEVVGHNDRMNRVMDDFINPRGMNEYMITHDHFMERHKDQFVKKDPKAVLNTITNEYEMDWCQVEIKRGGFHVHTLISEVDDDVVLQPNKKIRKAIEKIYGMDEVPVSLLQSEVGMTRVKTDLIEYAIRKRCDFLGKSGNSLDIVPEAEYEGYDGYSGWKGLIAYVTKNMYNVDNMVEIYDAKNSTILGN
jgi:hypothetical protein